MQTQSCSPRLSMNMFKEKMRKGMSNVNFILHRVRSSQSIHQRELRLAINRMKAFWIRPYTRQHQSRTGGQGQRCGYSLLAKISTAWRTDGPTDQWTDGPTDQRTDGPTDRRTDGPTDRRTKPLIEMRGRILKEPKKVPRQVFLYYEEKNFWDTHEDIKHSFLFLFY